MSESGRRPLQLNDRLEYVLASAILAGILYGAVFYLRQGYLPQPFYYDTRDSLMDLYSTAYWAHRPGMYAVWYSLYPPISFVYLKLTTVASCYRGDVAHGRDCDAGAFLFLAGFFLLNIVLVYRSYVRRDRTTAVPRTIAVALGLPMLYGLDRGNLVIPCFTCFVLALGGVVRSARWRWFAMALAVNFKVYLALAVIVHLVRHRWRQAAGAAIAVALAWLAGFALIGDGSPLQILRDGQEFTSEGADQFWERMYYATSYAPYLRLIRSAFPLLQFMPSRLVDDFAFWAHLAIIVGQVGTVLACLAAQFNPRGVASRPLVALLLVTVLTSTEFSGGYAQIFTLFLVFFQPSAGYVRQAMLLAAYLLCVPADLVMTPIFHTSSDVFWSGRRVVTMFGLSLGQLVRPGLLLVIQYCLVVINLRQVRWVALPMALPATGESR